MNEPATLSQVLSSRRQDVARLWLEGHLAATPPGTEREVVTQVHERAGAFLEALARAVESPDPDDWSGFDHREAVQLMALMANAFAVAGVSAGAAAALVAALGHALDQVGATGFHLLPLACVSGEAYVAARLAAQAARELERLVRTTPVLTLPGGVVLLAVTGSPDRGAASALADRALRRVLAGSGGRPRVLVDMSHLETDTPEVVADLLALSADVEALDGTCVVSGLSGTHRDLAARAGVDVSDLLVRETARDALAELLPSGLLHRLGRAFR